MIPWSRLRKPALTIQENRHRQVIRQELRIVLLQMSNEFAAMQWSFRFPDFTTSTCFEWKPLLADNRAKDIIIESLRYLVLDQRVVVYGFVIMSNHIHLVWQIIGDRSLAQVQRDFLRYTSQRILQLYRNINSPMYDELVIAANDRMRTVWQRRSFSRSIQSRKFLNQKINYIHNNPTKAGLCKKPDDYKYSSAGFYLLNRTEWDFLSHYDG
ncbi:MAG TPA: transposase [Cytophagales bacterium]|nr:transposase [Cytophagales bacterium]